MRILAIDPGYDRCGIAVLEKVSGREILLHSDCLRSNKSDDFSLRLAMICAGVEGAIAQFAPTSIALEKLFFAKNQKTAMAVAETRGALLALAGAHQIPIIEYTPNQIKLSVTGYGAATKGQMMKMIPKLVTITKSIEFDDEYDAIAVGLTHMACYRLV
jgi:crossover junction endodeoxyribonuclease RuvC